MELALAHRKPKLEELCRRFRVRRLELFGSAATERYSPENSDIDFLVEFATPAPGAASLRFAIFSFTDMPTWTIVLFGYY